MNTRRSTFVRILVSALALIAGPVALAGDVDPSVQEIAQGVAYGSVTSGTGGAQSAASDQGPMGYGAPQHRSS